MPGQAPGVMRPSLWRGWRWVWGKLTGHSGQSVQSAPRGGRQEEQRRGCTAGGSPRQKPHTRPCPRHPPGEPYVTIKAYTAAAEDELSLSEGEAIEVIHKLLDGWWVVR